MGWIQKDDRWLADRVQRENRAAAGSNLAIEDSSETNVSEYGITVFVLKCPKKACKSLDILLYCSKPWEGDRRKKYYLCNTCNHRFRVTEINRE